MTGYDQRPWLTAYPADRGPHLRRAFPTALDMFDAAVTAVPHSPAIHYFDSTLTWTEVDRAANALAWFLIARGFSAGDRLALCLQNNPAFVIGVIAAWKAGGTATPISPMATSDELSDALASFAPTALLILDDLYSDRARAVLATGATSVRIVVTVSALDGQTRDDARVFDGTRRRKPGDTVDLMALIAEASVGSGPAAQQRRVGPSDIALLASTSGTTGPSKGAQITHANLAFNAQVYRDWTGLRPGEPVLALAPVFHVTGLVGAVATALINQSPLIMTHRFHPTVIADACREWQPAFCVAVITAYIALAGDPDVKASDLASLRLRYSGGAPIEPDVADRLEERLGGYIHNVYGQTETTSPSHAVPPGVSAPVSDDFEVLSVGIPVFDTIVRIVDDDGNDLPVGEIGELVTTGPQVIHGYWNDPVATADAFSGGSLRTGDVGFMDPNGWFYIVDRKKNIINAAGYKVWPSEVERRLQSHPAIAEAAVIGVPDGYRGETVKAFIVTNPGATMTVGEVIAYCRDHLAAYKYPHEVEFVSALPRTATGKLLRRALR
ncbi:class I adenylate-forming enzyme family protein [Gordonia sp. (in: high G+C Gram-positive bacteria)]|uniref:class I adenylate-forming enzyme family protein n=1 Tax=Gordonia sp. (in: high G+C Gram-positive bacteria) TaxID=84139 RepID=UPI003C7744EC